MSSDVTNERPAADAPGPAIPDPLPYAQRWIETWNARDLEAVLRDYADDVVFTSPTALRFVPSSGGIVRGKQALREYWVEALAGHPDLHFTLEGVYAGIDTIAIHYRHRNGSHVVEVLTFRDGLVAVGHATHLIAAPHADWT
jgi:hypothetical protein